MIDLTGPKAHPALALIHELNIPVYKVAHWVGFSVSHTSKILHGQYRGGREVRKKLDELVEHLESKRGK